MLLVYGKENFSMQVNHKKNYLLFSWLVTLTN